MNDRLTADGKYERVKMLAPIVVNGQCSLWFAWAPNGFQGPTQYSNGYEGEECRPVRVVIQDPVDAVEVSIDGGSTGAIWCHGTQAHECGTANGRDATQNSNAEYQSVTYNSQHIQRLETNLCRLVAMSCPQEPPQSPVEQVPCGVGATIVDVPGDTPKTLYLGMHDAFEWNNNSGTQQVVVTLLRAVKT